ncbi:hypothetical protein DVK00_18975 [Haloarcula sp. Atlit-47R]|nr:hypothetical protein DVK00_18975 [Haloarcula sp. Atlit-47R]
MYACSTGSGISRIGQTLSLYDRAIERDIERAEQSPFVDIPFADHTDQRPDPPEINGRVPDEIRRNNLTNNLTAVERETHPNSKRSRRQNAALREGALDIGIDFEMEPVDEDDFR